MVYSTLFCLGNNDIFFSTKFLNKISESRSSIFFSQTKAALVV